MITVLTLVLLLAPPQGDVALDNAWVRVTRNAAPCASARPTGCGHRVIVALGDTEIRAGGGPHRLARSKAGRTSSPHSNRVGDLQNEVE